MSTDDGSVSGLVIDAKENPWIDKLINTLRDAGKRQSCAPVAGASPISGGNNKPECQARNCPDPSEGKISTCDLLVDLEKPSWVDDLVKALHGVADFYAIDPAIRADVKEHLKCDGGKRLSISGLIRFRGREHSLDDAATDSIDSFVTRIDKQASRWGVFGFASEAGDIEENRKLSLRRACAVKEYICKDDVASPLCKLECKTYPKDKDVVGEAKTGHRCLPADGNKETGDLICFLGEEHFINGVADSRSVVIAACTIKE